jgi:hypothetical protein
MVTYSPLYILNALVAVGSLICFILVLVRMFQAGEAGMGPACIMLFLLCGIGYFLTFAYGWIKADRWGIRNVMIAWTAFLIFGAVIGGIAWYLTAPPLQVG